MGDFLPSQLYQLGFDNDSSLLLHGTYFSNGDVNFSKHVILVL